MPDESSFEPEASESEARRTWRRVLNALDITRTYTEGRVTVVRVNHNKLRVAQNGTSRTFGGRNSTYATAVQQALNYLTGEDVPLLCSRCGQRPRKVGTSWCLSCSSQGAGDAKKARRRRVRSDDIPAKPTAEVLERLHALTAHKEEPRYEVQPPSTSAVSMPKTEPMLKQARLAADALIARRGGRLPKGRTS